MALSLRLSKKAHNYEVLSHWRNFWSLRKTCIDNHVVFQNILLWLSWKCTINMLWYVYVQQRLAMMIQGTLQQDQSVHHSKVQSKQQAQVSVKHKPVAHHPLWTLYLDSKMLAATSRTHNMIKQTQSRQSIKLSQMELCEQAWLHTLLSH